MQKDVIYIDVEDDITAIIGKVKDANEKIVALVPPKRIGVLQSAVNLRLLGRAADSNGKRLVLVTNNQALVALAAAAKLPVSKNLQSKPELAEIPVLDIDDGDDVIDGAELPVGELARTAPLAATTTAADLDIEDAIRDNAAEKPVRAVAPVAGVAAMKPRAKSGIKVPNFSTFRKKLLLIIAGVILLIGFLIWAIVFAPRATIVITAKTSSATIDQKVTLSPNASTTFASSTVRSVVQTQKKQTSVEFDATGKKDVGEKATGTVKFSTNSISNLGTTIPAGTTLTTSGGQTFTTDSSVTMTINNYTGANTGVTASSSGTKNNGASGSVSGAPSGISASLVGATGGGTDKEVTVVTAEDVQTASAKLTTADDTDTKNQLKAGFDKGTVIIDTSYTVKKADPTSTPAVGQEATGKAKLSAEVTYTMYGIAPNELKTFLDAGFDKQLTDKSAQRVYANGSKDLSFTQFTTDDSATSVKLTANGQIGPKINDDDIKQQARGKRYGEVQSELESLSGVSDVDVKFSPFWVRTVPNDVKRISIKFEINAES